jgi:hypothetical protein
MPGKSAGRASVVIVAAFTIHATLPTGAKAVSPSVRSACANDYFAYCSNHDPDGPGVRQCMRRVGPRLSQGCLSALAAAGEIPKRHLAKKQLAKRAQLKR